jgi:outer membrane biosynthesis protein TonB
MPRFVRLPGTRLPTWSSTQGGVWVRDVLVFDAELRPTRAALLGLGVLVVLAFVVAFVLSTQAPGASGRTAKRTPAAAATGTAGAGPAMTSLRLDPVRTLPDLQRSTQTRSPQPAEIAAPSSTPTTEPTTTPTPAAERPVQSPATPTPAAKPKPKPSPSPAGEQFDSSG